MNKIQSDIHEQDGVSNSTRPYAREKTTGLTFNTVECTTNM